MSSITLMPRAYTPDQVAEMLQMSKNTVYGLIAKGEIIAKKFGKAYRIPASSLSFIFTGLDYDIYKMEREDLKNLKKINETMAEVRAKKKNAN